MSIAERAAGLAELGAQAALGFTPVQQGGGVGQGANKVFAGWDGANLRVTVDTLDLGKVWADVNAGGSYDDGAGYLIQRFPCGTAFVLGSAVVTPGSDGHVTLPLPITFLRLYWALGANGDFNVALFTVHAVPRDASSLDLVLVATNNTAQTGTVRVNYLAWGRWR